MILGGDVIEPSNVRFDETNLNGNWPEIEHPSWDAEDFDYLDEAEPGHEGEQRPLAATNADEETVGMGGEPSHIMPIGDESEHVQTMAPPPGGELRRSSRIPTRTREYWKLPPSSTALIMYDEALASPEKEEWLNAMKKEKDQFEAYGVFKSIARSELPPDARFIPAKWVLTRKKDSDGKEAGFKGRWTAKGYSQVKGRDFHEN